MPNYTALVELNEIPVDELKAIDLRQALASYHASVSRSPRGWLTIRITVPADSLAQATMTALAVIQSATTAHPISIEAMTTAESDARGRGDLVQLLTVAEAAASLKVSTARVRQMIAEGKFPYARQEAGSAWMIPRLDIVRAIPKPEPVQDFDYGDVTLENLREQSTEVLEDLNDRMNHAFDELGHKTGPEDVRLRQSMLFNTWLYRLGEVLESRGRSS